MTQYITIEKLKNYLKAMAILDMIMVPKEDDWLRLVNFYKTDAEFRYILDNGSGDKLTVIFAAKGVMIVGFDHENELNQFAADEWDSNFFEYTYSNMPEELKQLLSEEEKDETTFCMWCTDGTNWMQNETEDNDGGKEYLLGYIRHNAEEWCEWAEEYYDTEVALELVQKVFRGELLGEDDIVNLNPECKVEEVLYEISGLLI